MKYPQDRIGFPDHEDRTHFVAGFWKDIDGNFTGKKQIIRGDIKI